ncbi:MAG: single-stranded DNA-binding protein [Candidatus Magasanikbacteria bacterium]|jgi:single-strand DNA-binding protein
MDLNRVTLIGRLTRDPEVRSTPAGRSVATITVATGRTWTDQAGQKQKESEFHNVVMWAKLADIAGQYLRKGARLYVEGRLKTRDWTGQDGVKRYRTEIVGDNMIMLDGPARSGTSPSPASSNSESSEASEGPQPVIEEEIKVEDIPF